MPEAAPPGRAGVARRRAVWRGGEEPTRVGGLAAGARGGTGRPIRRRGGDGALTNRGPSGAAPAAARTALLHQVVAVLRDRTLGPVALALFTHGCGQGAFTPFVALWVANAYHRGGAAIAAYFACTALGGLVLNPGLGRLSDRLRRRRPTALLATGAQGAGLALLAWRPPFWLALVVAATLMTAQVQPHLFALVDDYLGAGRAGLPRGATIAIERTTISAAWALGAPLGGWLLGRHADALFAVAALLNAVSALCTALWCREVARGAEAAPEPAAALERAAGAAASGPPAWQRTPVRWDQLLLYGAGVALITGGNVAKMQAVPLYLAHLGLRSTLVGVTFSWMAALEMVLMPPVGRLADRMARRWVVALGAGGGALFFGAIALAPGAGAVVLAFPAASFMIAALAGVGIGYAQDLDPRHPGLAGGVYFAASGVGVVAGGALIAAAEHALGLPRAFLWPALSILCGGAGVLFTRPLRSATTAAAPRPAAAAGV